MAVVASVSSDQEVETPQSFVDAALSTINEIRRKNFIRCFVTEVLLALTLGWIALGVWSWTDSDIGPSHYLVFVTAAISYFLFHRPKAPKAIERNNLVTFLELNYPQIDTSLLTLSPRDDASKHAKWLEATQAHVAQTREQQDSTFHQHTQRLLMPVAMLLFLFFMNPGQMFTPFAQAGNVVGRMFSAAKIRVVEGAMAPEEWAKARSISTSSPAKIELMMENLIEISVPERGQTNGHKVELRRISNKDGTIDPAAFQTFQVGTDAQHADGETPSISFQVNESVAIFIPQISSSKPLAYLNVRALPVPNVELQLMTQVEDPWPDEKPLPFKIFVDAENPLQQINLIIKAEGRVTRELVSNVLAQDMKEVTTDYTLSLEPYVQEDIAEVEIVAEAIDRSLPAPLIGRSQPLILKVASAYGRYKETLATMRELKSIADEQLGKQAANMPQQAEEAINKAAKQAENSPFFDGLDRVQIQLFQNEVRALKNETNAGKLIELSNNLNQFLFEHESLDDRERDRDFFVAIRTLSRLVEKPHAERNASVSLVVDRLLTYLDGRQKRWEMRVSRLAKGSRPKSWESINAQKPFHRGIKVVEEKDRAKTPAMTSQALETLSNVTRDYRRWIEELEAKEDESRNKEEEQRQEGLVSARNEIKELQRRQAEISTFLDRAKDQDSAELAQQWPSNRASQNTNMTGTKRLENQMRSIAPGAGERLTAAAEAMQITIDAGNASQFDNAESASDMAGRLLRQADNAAEQSQRSPMNRGRRRRVAGDNYYGQAVVGGDVEIKRDYQVDKRYREEILDEVRQTLGNQTINDSEENRHLLENYLRQVVR